MVLNSVENEVDRLMREGQAAAKRGDKVMARALLTQLIERDPHNEKAWMWLSGAVGDLVEQQTCLENVLIINPRNAQARKGLEFIVNRTGTPSQVLVNLSATESVRLAEDGGVPPPTHLFDSSFDALEPFQPPDDAPSAPVSQAPAGPMSPYPDVQPVAGMESDNLSPWSRSSLEYTSPLASVDITGGAGFNANPTDEFGLPPWEQPTGGAPQLASSIPNPSDQDLYTGGPPVPAPAPDLESAIPDWVKKGGAHDVSQTTQIEEPPDVMPFSPFDTQLDGPQMTATSGSSLPSGDVEALEDGIDAWLSKFATGAISLPDSEDEDEPAEAEQLPNPPQVAPAPAPHDPFAAMSLDDLGPYGATQLPSPDELPGGSTDGSQPWYLKGSEENLAAPPARSGGDQATHSDHLQSDTSLGSGQLVASIPCPHCREQVPETSLACPNCRYNFFVHCPSCHELLDTSDARPGATEACQYCGTTVNRYELGQMYATDLKGTTTLAEPVEDKDAWVGTTLQQPKKGFSFNIAWVVDVLWVLAIALVVWALTQLPAWFNLTGLYN